jgi:hypothetical protein
MAKGRKTVNHPWVQVAAFCDQLLVDKTDTYSLIRVVDRFAMRRPPDWDGKTHISVPLTALLAFKSGDVKGTQTVRLYHTSPKGKRKKMLEKEIEFLGGDVGANVQLNMMLGIKTEGTHWIDVYVGRWLATRMPLTVVLLSDETPQDESAQKKK